MIDRAGMIQQDRGPTDRTVADIIQDMVRDIQEIFRSEIRLAKAEVSEKVSHASGAAALFAGAGAAGLLAGMTFVCAVVAFLAMWLAIWLAALIVAIVLGASALVLYAAARSRMKEIDPVPEKTIETVKEDVEWAKQQTK
jgi:hypothetical protein